jgi:hypothetical protein
MRISLLTLVLALPLAACTDKTDDSNDPGTAVDEREFIGLSATPESLALGVGQTQQLTILAEYDDGTTQDVTSAADYRVVNASVAEVSATGLVTALGTGSTDIEVSYQDMDAVIRAGVGSAALEGEVSVRGYPVAGVEVSLSGLATERATTNEDGEYVFDGLPGGEYTVVPVFDNADRAGESAQTVTVPSTGTATQDLVLTRGAYPTGPDAFEPNSVPGNGSSIDVDVLQNHTLWKSPASVADGGDRDYFRVSVEEGETYDFVTFGLCNNCDTILRLYEADGVTGIAFNDDSPASLNSLLTHTAEITGELVFRVEAYEDDPSGANAFAVVDYFVGVLTTVNQDDDSVPAILDCDDNDEEAEPFSTEIPGNGVDDDCFAGDADATDPNEPNDDRANATSIPFIVASPFEGILDSGIDLATGVLDASRRGGTIDTDWFSVVVPASGAVHIGFTNTAFASVQFLEADGVSELTLVDNALVNETDAPVTYYVTVSGTAGEYVMWAVDLGIDEDGDGDYPRQEAIVRDCAEGDMSRDSSDCAN